jgi:hypothetical protein
LPAALFWQGLTNDRGDGFGVVPAPAGLDGSASRGALNASGLDLQASWETEWDGLVDQVFVGFRSKNGY